MKSRCPERWGKHQRPWDRQKLSFQLSLCLSHFLVWKDPEIFSMLFFKFFLTVTGKERSRIRTGRHGRWHGYRVWKHERKDDRFLSIFETTEGIMLPPLEGTMASTYYSLRAGRLLWKTRRIICRSFMPIWSRSEDPFVIITKKRSVGFRDTPEPPLERTQDE